MKKLISVVLWAILIATLFVVCACEDASLPLVEVKSTSYNVEIKDSLVDDYDYTKLFSISKNGENVTVEKSFLDLSAVSANSAAFTVTCTYEGKVSAVTVKVLPTVYGVELSQKELELEDRFVADCDFNSYFTVTVDGNVQSVTDEMVSSDVKAEEGSYSYTVSCGTAQATLVVKVVHVERIVSLSQTELTLKQPSVEGFDFNALFQVTEDGRAVAITAQMVTSNVKAEVGSYSYTVSYQNASATLKVVVVDGHELLAVAAYKQLPLSEEQLQNFDYTSLFSLFVDGVAVEVTNQMIDTSAVQNVSVGKTYNVSFSYTYENSSCQAEVAILVVPPLETKVVTKQIVTYPNSEYIELTTLFDVTVGDAVVAVTNDMISGTIDYSREGTNEIVLTYDGEKYVSTVEVKRGVIIDYANSQVVTVKKGTDQDSYPFADDFVVLVNGLRFRNVDLYIDRSSVDFSVAGSYTATISVPYNENKTSGLAGSANLTYVEKTITYNVVETVYTLEVKQDVVTLPLGTTSYNAFENLSLSRNGNNNSVGSHRDWINAIYCYGEVTSEAIDFSVTDPQQVTILLYVDCTDPQAELGTPVEVSFTVRVVGDVKLVGTNQTTFGNATVFATDLFSLTVDGQEVPVTFDMISGKVDTFHAGTYIVSAQYMGVEATAKVVVVNPDLVGTYSTQMTTVATATTNSDSSDWDYGEETDPDGDYESASQQAVQLGDLVIRANGTVALGTKTGSFVDAVDENTILVKLGSYLYTLYYNNGIVVLDPDNSVKLGFSDSSKRPYVYFDSAMWTVDKHIVVNSGANYVLAGSNVGCSYDIQKIVSAKDESVSLWYCLKTELISKTSSDTIYQVSWGKASFSESFVPQKGNVATLYFDDEETIFTMQSGKVGTVNRNTDENLWGGKTFRGTVEGLPATLTVSSATNLSFNVNGTKVIGATSYELVNYMKNGGCNYAESTVLLYNLRENEGAICSYKFLVNAEENTFELLPQDGLLGKYVTDDGKMWLFLDGYGTGIINFNAASGYTTQFTYKLVNQELEISFLNTNSMFEYGKKITFNLADLKNILTVKYCVVPAVQGKVFQSIQVTDGALVTFSATTVESGSNCKNSIYESIKIVTKDGELSTAEKRATVDGVPVVDLSAVDQNKAGIYQIAVNVSVDGKIVKSLYAVQVLKPQYADNPVVANYGSGVVNSGYVLALDAYGTVSLDAIGVRYSGYAMYRDGGFTARAFAQDGSSVTLLGEAVANGVVLVRCTGAVSFGDYFTTGSKQVAGCDGNVLRKLTVEETPVYIYSASATALGEVVTVDVDKSDNDVLIFTTQRGAAFAVKAVWGNDTSKGLTLADRFRGTYTAEGCDDLCLDGFGNATVGAISGNYHASDNNITFVWENGVEVYRLNVSQHTYTKLDVDYQKAVLNKTFTATYLFLEGGSTPYSATTSFHFGEGGVVTVISTCPDYGKDYAPTFASDSGVEGTYKVDKNNIFIYIGGKTFAFYTNDVIQCSIIICSGTSLASDDTGYFAVGSRFFAEN